MVRFCSIKQHFLIVGEPNIGTDRKTNSGQSPSQEENEIDLDPDHTRQGLPTEKVSGAGQDNQEVLIMNTKSEDRTASFFAQPGILAGKLRININFKSSFEIQNEN